MILFCTEPGRTERQLRRMLLRSDQTPCSPTSTQQGPPYSTGFADALPPVKPHSQKWLVLGKETPLSVECSHLCCAGVMRHLQAESVWRMGFPCGHLSSPDLDWQNIYSVVQTSPGSLINIVQTVIHRSSVRNDLFLRLGEMNFTLKVT